MYMSLTDAYQLEGVKGIECLQPFVLQVFIYTIVMPQPFMGSRTPFLIVRRHYLINISNIRLYSKVFKMNLSSANRGVDRV